MERPSSSPWRAGRLLRKACSRAARSTTRPEPAAAWAASSAAPARPGPTAPTRRRSPSSRRSRRAAIPAPRRPRPTRRRARPIIAPSTSRPSPYRRPNEPFATSTPAAAGDHPAAAARASERQPGLREGLLAQRQFRVMPAIAAPSPGASTTRAAAAISTRAPMQPNVFFCHAQAEAQVEGRSCSFGHQARLRRRQHRRPDRAHLPRRHRRRAVQRPRGELDGAAVPGALTLMPRTADLQVRSLDRAIPVALMNPSAAGVTRFNEG